MLHHILRERYEIQRQLGERAGQVSATWLQKYVNDKYAHIS